MAAERLSQAKKRKTVETEEQQPKRARTDSDDSVHDDDELQVAGKIKRVFMKNFMCHDAMEVKFNPKVNFIVGANGSGKSAILTALTVCFGARAKETNRGPSIKEFIKKGKSSASVELTITNNGPMAFKYENYGDSITIIRNIGAASTYRIKNWRGDTVSTKKEELDNIVNFMNIQVDNPISVLNQDIARNFLTSSAPTDKYKLFMKATRLDSIYQNYKEATESSEVTYQRLAETRKFLSENEKKIKQLKKKVKDLESLDIVKEEYNYLQQEQHWASVIQEEKKLLETDVKIQEQEKNMQKLENLESTKATKEKEIDSKIEDLKEEIMEVEAEASNGTAKLNETKKKFTDAKKVHDEKKEKARDLHSTIKRKQSDIETLQNEIKKVERENSAAGDRKQKARTDIVECEQKLDQVEATLRTKQTDLMHLEENRRRIEQEDYKMKIDLEQKNSTLRKLKQQLNAFKNQPNDALTVYGSDMPRLLRRIEEENNRGRFRKKPLGPLGSYIKLKDSSWIPAIENHLGAGTLMSFCVDNGQDGRILETIMKEVFRGERYPQIVISKFFDQMHDVSNGCTQSPKFLNLLEAMEISHPVIANSLIDQREIECILLIPTSDEACTVMSDARRVPRNCKRAITKQADLFFPDPNYKTYGGSVSRAKYLQVSTSEAIQSLQEEISVTDEELSVIQQEYSNIHDRMRKNKEELQQVNLQVRRLMSDQQQLKNKIEESKEIIESCNNNTINTFMTEIEELQRIVVQKKEEESHMLEEIRQSQKNLEILSTEYKNCRDLAQNLDSRLSPIKEKIKELKDEKNRLNVSNQGATRRMEEAKHQLQKLNGEHQQQQRVVNSKITIAEETCPRINTKKSVAEINTRLRELKATIENVERQHGTKDVLKKELEEKEAKYEGILEFYAKLNRSNDKQLDRLRNRKSLYKDMKKRISERVQQSFKNVLNLRNYKGQVIIDHQKLELHLEVIPVNDGKRPTNDARALSGGERSYSTVAFILALWDSTGLPFYFLDEFDVFMDKINRRVILDILLGHAQSHPSSQFTFLTPLDTSSIRPDSSITIHRLDPPERAA